MDPMKPADPRPNQIVMESTNPVMTEWKETQPDEKVLMETCPKCASWAMRVLRRVVTDRNGETHREYKVKCLSCGYQTQVHWSKRLSQQEWNWAGR